MRGLNGKGELYFQSIQKYQKGQKIILYIDLLNSKTSQLFSSLPFQIQITLSVLLFWRNSVPNCSMKQESSDRFLTCKFYCSGPQTFDKLVSLFYSVLFFTLFPSLTVGYAIVSFIRNINYLCPIQATQSLEMHANFFFFFFFSPYKIGLFTSIFFSSNSCLLFLTVRRGQYIVRTQKK